MGWPTTQYALPVGRKKGMKACLTAPPRLICG